MAEPYLVMNTESRPVRAAERLYGSQLIEQHSIYSEVALHSASLELDCQRLCAFWMSSSQQRTLLGIKRGSLLGQFVNQYWISEGKHSLQLVSSVLIDAPTLLLGNKCPLTRCHW